MIRPPGDCIIPDVECNDDQREAVSPHQFPRPQQVLVRTPPVHAGVSDHHGSCDVPRKLGLQQVGDRLLMLNLQGAYSIRRYKENHRLPFPASLFSKGEGSPYLMHKKLSAKTVLTWSVGDTANPLAQFVTGAAHAGGEAGYEESLEMKETFTQLEWVKGTKIRPDCAAYRDDGKILMVNANSFVKDHNDILDQEMGDFIWQIISCFTYPR